MGRRVQRGERDWDLVCCVCAVLWRCLALCCAVLWARAVLWSLFCLSSRCFSLLCAHSNLASVVLLSCAKFCSLVFRHARLPSLLFAVHSPLDSVVTPVYLSRPHSTQLGSCVVGWCGVLMWSDVARCGDTRFTVTVWWMFSYFY